MLDNTTLLITGPGPFQNNILKLIDQAQALNVKIVLSTWTSSKKFTDRLSSQISIIYSEDIESGPGYKYRGVYKDNNFDRQFVLMSAARQMIRRNFIIRVRSDIYINLEKLENFMYNIINGHILTLDVSSVNPINIFSSSKLLYHPCDWMYVTSRQQFDLMLDRASRYYHEYIKTKGQIHSSILIEGHDYVSPMTGEQMFWASFIGVSMSHRLPRVGQGLVTPYSSIGMGVVIIEGKRLDLMSNKQKLKVLSRTSASSRDTYKYSKYELTLNALIRQIAYYIRRIT